MQAKRSTVAEAEAEAVKEAAKAEAKIKVDQACVLCDYLVEHMPILRCFYAVL